MSNRNDEPSYKRQRLDTKDPLTKKEESSKVDDVSDSSSPCPWQEYTTELENDDETDEEGAPTILYAPSYHSSSSLDVYANWDDGNDIDTEFEVSSGNGQGNEFECILSIDDTCSNIENTRIPYSTNGKENWNGAEDSGDGDVESNDNYSKLETSNILSNTGNLQPPLRDGWHCLQCGKNTSSPMKYCSPCYKIKREQLESRKKRCQKSRSRQKKNISEKEKTAAQCLYQQSASANEQTHPLNVSDDSKRMPCDLCGIFLVDGAFIHGQSGHVLYCFKCSERIWRQSRKCPVCRRSISRVVKLFMN